MKTARERVVEWLRDAHAMEEQAHTMLGKTAQQIDGHPNFREGLDAHGKHSARQAAQLKSCLETLGESTSAVKTVTGQISAFAQTLSGYIVGDEPVKAVLASATFAHMEATSYRILVAAAAEAGMNEVAAVCRPLLTEEHQFVRWLDDQADIVTRDYLDANAPGG